MNGAIKIDNMFSYTDNQLLLEHMKEVLHDWREDSQVAGSFIQHDDPMAVKLHIESLPIVRKLIGKEVEPSYTFSRVCFRGNILKNHMDRDACEYSISYTVGYDGDEVWPLYIKFEDGIEKHLIDVNQALLYQGIENFHWRQPFKGERWYQVFFHYVDPDGDYKEWVHDKTDHYDGL